MFYKDRVKSLPDCYFNVKNPPKSFIQKIRLSLKLYFFVIIFGTLYVYKRNYYFWSLDNKGSRSARPVQRSQTPSHPTLICHLKLMSLHTCNIRHIFTLIWGIVNLIPGRSARPVKSWSMYSKTM